MQVMFAFVVDSSTQSLIFADYSNPFAPWLLLYSSKSPLDAENFTQWISLYILAAWEVF